MITSLQSRIQVFDPQQGFAVVERRLPHWSQAGAIAFITWRTWDSIPAQVLESWLTERDAWLKRHGISSHLAPRDGASRGARRLHWRDQLHSLDPAVVREFQRHFSDRWNEDLDQCHGACILRQPKLAQIVADSLLHFDGQRYDLTDFVVMPNHVHVLAAFPDEESMLTQCDSWKHFASTQINRELGRRGRLWQQDDFDHLVRSSDHFDYFRRYIAENPRRANLKPGDYLHMSKPL
ncbi:MAG: transposase [Pirellulales bacterium]|nr:transposase [Pirellulales bacterium]